MSSDPLETELINKINELQQEAKEHQLVLDAFKSVEPERRCFRLIGGVLVERTVKDIKPSLEENLVNIDKAVLNLNQTIMKRREEQAKQAPGESSSAPGKVASGPSAASAVTGPAGVLA